MADYRIFSKLSPYGPVKAQSNLGGGMIISDARLIIVILMCGPFLVFCLDRCVLSHNGSLSKLGHFTLAIPTWEPNLFKRSSVW